MALELCKQRTQIDLITRSECERALTCFRLNSKPDRMVTAKNIFACKITDVERAVNRQPDSRAEESNSRSRLILKKNKIS